MIRVLLLVALGQICGDGIVDPGENCDTCPEDVQCLDCEICVAQQCFNKDCPVPPCGDGIVDPGENCFTCPEDVPCGLCQECSPIAKCIGNICTCGDGIIDPGENCENCAADVPCDKNEFCLDGKCITKCNPGIAPMEIIVVMDTSGSMINEAGQLCGGLAGLEDQLLANGLDVSIILLRISELGMHKNFWCLGDSVNNIFNVNLHLESWGPATEIIAEQWPWSVSALGRIIVPISDEGPFQGNPCNGNDEVSILAAIMACNVNSVIASPIVFDACALPHGQLLADSTGGILGDGLDIIGDIYSLIDATLCGCTGDLNNDGFVDVLDFLILLANWGEIDLDGDGDTDIVDMLLMFSNWGACSNLF